jgi:plasmid stabilization system protein ParE
MSREILKKPRAGRDLMEYFAFIARDMIAPADRFLQVAEETFEYLARLPTARGIWESPLPQLDGIRVYAMPSRYRNYLIFYRFDDATLEVIAVIHGARNLEAVLARIILSPPRATGLFVV